MVNIGRKVPMHLYHIPVNIIQNVVYVLISQERLIWTGMSGEREHMLRKRLKPGFSLVLENKGWLDLRWSSTNRWGKQLGKKNCLEFKILKCPRTNLPWKYVLFIMFYLFLFIMFYYLSSEVLVKEVNYLSIYSTRL